jgi:cell division cycle 20, cofactor of APC complex
LILDSVTAVPCCRVKSTNELTFLFLFCTNRFLSNNSPGATRFATSSHKHTLDLSRPKTPTRFYGADRFIPNRARINVNQAMLPLNVDDDFRQDRIIRESPEKREQREAYESALRSALLGDDERVLAFSESAPKPIDGNKILYSTLQNEVVRKVRHTRKLPDTPINILDAPGLMDDYYLNLVAWSDNNVIAVGLTNSVYLWNATNGTTTELCTLRGDADTHVSSVTWIEKGGKYLAVGSTSGGVQIWDVETQKLIRTMWGHTNRISALAWNNNIVSSGCRDAVIINHDVRIADHQIATLKYHSGQVCQLAWSSDGSTLASGGNDDRVCIWDINARSYTKPRFNFTAHKAAVKALSWSPHERNVLATGGGSADRCIKFWNTQNGNMLNSIETSAQVCALTWNPHSKEILSSHGYGSNSLCLWKYPTMALVKEFQNGARGLHLALSPDGGSVCVGSADETLRIWNIFSLPPKTKASGISNLYSKCHQGDLPLSDAFWKGMQIR